MFKKLIAGAATAFLLLGTYSAAMAQGGVVDCSTRGGTITSGEFDGIVADRFGDDCTIVGVVIGAQGVTVRNQSNFILVNSVVREGDVTVRDTATASVLANFMDGGDIVMRSNEIARVNQNSSFNGGGIRVLDEGEPSQWTEVLGNDVTGNLRVNGNLSAAVKGNRASGANITCQNNENLDAANNFALEGRVECSRAAFTGAP